MKRIIVTYGIIAGIIVAVLLFLSMPLWNQGILNFNNGMVAGYATMVIALSLIFFGIRSYRDNMNGGTVSFWQGMKIGLLITVIASVMYALAWEVCYRTVATDFVKNMSSHYVQEKVESGATGDELDKIKSEMASFEVMYENPMIRFAYTLMEILPVGIIISLVSAGLLRKKNFLPSSTTT